MAVLIDAHKAAYKRLMELHYQESQRKVLSGSVDTDEQKLARDMVMADLLRLAVGHQDKANAKSGKG